jgi:hypothetical protein
MDIAAQTARFEQFIKDARAIVYDMPREPDEPGRFHKERNIFTCAKYRTADSDPDVFSTVVDGLHLLLIQGGDLETLDLIGIKQRDQVWQATIVCRGVNAPPLAREDEADDNQPRLGFDPRRAK